MKKLTLIALAIASMSAQANPPIVTPHDGADCGVSPFPAINSPDYRIDCYNAQPFNPFDPTLSEGARWMIVNSSGGQDQNQVKDVQGITARTNGAYVVTHERQVINEGNNNNLRPYKGIVKNPVGGEGVDAIVFPAYVEPKVSTNPSNPNYAVGHASILTPDKNAPANGDAAFQTRSLDSASGKWEVGYEVKKDTVKVGMALQNTGVEFDDNHRMIALPGIGICTQYRPNKTAAWR